MAVMSEGILESPAHEPLREHLDAPLSLKKKRSWMQSLREVVQKGALTAKAAVDNFRGESISARRIEAMENGGITIKRQPTHDSCTPKSATKSLRGHITHHDKGSSFFSTVGRVSMVKGSASAGPVASISGHSGGKDSPQKNRYGKQNSISSSLAGSLRGLRRRTSQVVNTAYHERLPAQYPLPSSPVPIPVPALERLSLHFDPADFSMSSGLSANIKLSEECGKLQENHEYNEASLTNPIEAQPMQNPFSEAIPLSVGLLDVPRDSFEFGCLERSPSPMPGTNLTLEVDGATDGALHLFERSVMAKASRPELRPMRSLDAMAEACAMAHINDNHASFPRLTDATAAPSTQEGSLLRVYGEARSVSNRTASTSSSFPSDMQQVSRQSGHGSEPPLKSKAGQTVDVAARDITVFDAVASSGPPSPTTSVTLPFRCRNITALNRTLESVNAEVFGALVDDAMNPNSIQPGTKLAADAHLFSNSAASTSAYVAPMSAEDCGTLKRHDSSTSKGVLYPWPTTTPASSALQNSNHHHDHLKCDDLISTDYDEFKTQQLFGGSDIEELPLEYHSDITDYDDIAAIDPVFWKFSSDQWLENPSGLPSDEEYVKHAKAVNDNKCASQYARLHDTRVDYAEQLVRPNDADSLKPDMGDRTEFELKRSTRNMRYNALHQRPSSEKRRPHVASKSTDEDLASGNQATSDNETPLTFDPLPSRGLSRSRASGSKGRHYDSPTSFTSSLQATVSRVSELLFDRLDCDTETPDRIQPGPSSLSSGYPAEDSSVTVGPLSVVHKPGGIDRVP